MSEPRILTPTDRATIRQRFRSPQEHARMAEELLDLANQHMHKRDRSQYRHGWWQRRNERRSYENAMYILGVARTHSALAIASAQVSPAEAAVLDTTRQDPTDG